MYSPADDHVVRYTQKNQKVYASTIKNPSRHPQQDRHTAKRSGGERTGSDQHQSAMELRLFSPIDCKHKWDGKGYDVIERNEKYHWGTGLVELDHVEPLHSNGSPDAERSQHGGECSAEPAHHPMPS